MAYEIIWLPKAETRFAEIIEYLEEYWDHKVVASFIKKTSEKILQIAERPKMSRRSGKMGIYEVGITKHNLLLYRVKGNRIELLTFFDTRQNPRRKFDL